jgi:hypothetical protein
MWCAQPADCLHRAAQNPLRQLGESRIHLWAPEWPVTARAPDDPGFGALPPEPVRHRLTSRPSPHFAPAGAARQPRGGAFGAAGGAA